ncbi:Cyst wall protein [Spironucleus salmonicida]|uniref:Cyst wall protein n=1 Tax=Spironucleus salmonicida TaxID=348837 RepID=V6LM33_9EUKA|nr:Cyst wall protein [Spironucleus salmonicida]|eukprot:EST45278.1 Cyst wall protein D [Spironucleus salmonicida]
MLLVLQNIQALTSFFADTNGKISWKNSTNWQTSIDFCSWHGVTCDTARDVVGISLRGNGLTGRLSESLEFLPKLKFLDLSNNTFETKLKAICAVRSLEIFSIQDSNVNFELPDCLCDMPNLKVLDVTGNNIIGNIPKCLKLDSLFIECNEIMDEIENNEIKELSFGCNTDVIVDYNAFKGVLTGSCTCKDTNNCQKVYKGRCGKYVHEGQFSDE